MDLSTHNLTLPQGTILRHLRIERQLGRGGFGVIYLATDQALDHPVAVKEYLPAAWASRQGLRVVPNDDNSAQRFQWGLERFVREARNLVRFRHPNIVRVTSLFEENGTAYMVMDFEEGESLRQALTCHSRNEESALKALFIPVCEGLEEVHRQGFIHRDIKPGNIVVRRDGSPVLLDFGSARNPDTSTDGALTALVSNGYAPLEQYGDAVEREQGPWTDIYALGAVLHFAISGVDPVDSPRRASAVFERLNDPLVAASVIGAGLYSENFLAAIDWALELTASDRPQSLSEWLPALTSGPPLLTADARTKLRGTREPDLLDETGVHPLERIEWHPSGTRRSGRSGEGQRDDLESITLSDLEPAVPRDLARPEPSPWRWGIGAGALAVLAGLGGWWGSRDDEALSPPVMATPQDMALQPSSIDTTTGALLDESGPGTDSEPSSKISGLAEPANETRSADALDQARTERSNDETAVAGELVYKRSDEFFSEGVGPVLLNPDVLAAQALARMEHQAEVRAAGERARRAAEQARLEREQQFRNSIAATRSALSRGELDRAEQELALAASARGDSMLVQSLRADLESARRSFARPVSDSELEDAVQRFHQLKRGLETGDGSVIDRLTEGMEQGELFRQLLGRYEKLDLSLIGIHVRNRDHSIVGTLRIERMYRSNNNVATPSSSYQDRILTTRRMADGRWSLIVW